eukprot:TRINITY_DN54458_c0_g1_i1.p1 TRINITY_DN54458_c0_g1~~TRINITY_DN54458_c0_g1_i1.p1  ORF type:complete len:422 (+),score=107.94 TRINITY_DN54458_c0_g1_i1:101-1366(+)
MGKTVQKGKTATTIVKTRRQGGYISKKAERGSGLKFKLETYITVGQFRPGTKVKYGPNPKRPDSKSFTRYAGYQKAATVGEALKCGAKVADLMWELERGDYKVIGGVRSDKDEIKAIGQKAFDKAQAQLASFSGPNGCPVKLNDPAAADKLAKEEVWRAERLKRVEKRAVAMKLKIETTEEIEASSESADIRLQRRVADAISREKLASGKKITDSDVTEVLEHWGFSENTNRLNVMQPGQKYVYSDTIGAIRARSLGFNPTPPTRRYPAFAKLLNKWVADNKPAGLKAKFVCSAINLNCNYNGRRHRDQNNEGPSIIRAFGKFKGGKLRYWAKDVKKPRPSLDKLRKEDATSFDLSKTTVVFDGNRAHEVDEFEGQRYSVVYFTASGWAKGKPKDVSFLRKECGFPYPEPGDIAKLKKASA